MELTCHCGNIKIKAAMPKDIAQCNCSICRRYAALWAYYTPNDVQITYKKEGVAFYIWGDKEVEFHRCNLCGCITHYITTQECREDILAINMNMAEAEIVNKLPIRKINGASY